jgi:hypothetical protein
LHAEQQHPATKVAPSLSPISSRLNSKLPLPLEAAKMGLFRLPSGEPENWVFIQSTGQSGNPLSSHCEDYAEAWGDGRYVLVLIDRAAGEEDALGTLVLTPWWPPPSTWFRARARALDGGNMGRDCGMSGALRSVTLGRCVIRYSLGGPARPAHA